MGGLIHMYPGCAKITAPGGGALTTTAGTQPVKTLVARMSMKTMIAFFIKRV
jgi:hypothetical protein